MTKKSHGFEVVSTKREYTNPYMEVYRQEVVRPDGLIKPYWVLDRGGDFSLIIPLFPDKTTQLVGQYRVPIAKYSWEFPMGMVAGAGPLVTAKQELREETGLRAKRWKKIGYFYLAPGFSGQRSHIYLAEGLSIGESEPEDDEYIETKRMPLKEVKALIQDGTIADGPTIIALHLLEQKGGITI
jgi:8-oxo-dGTP pyrophosphatase MutT (NUDIX family)